MRFRFLQVGKTVEDYLKTGTSIYEERIGHYVPFNVETIADLKKTKNISEEEIKRQEGKLILDRITSTDYLILLDEKGKEYTSVEFASHIEKLNMSGRPVTFLIGGPYGFSSEVYKRSNEKISLSKMTYSHQMVRLIFLEQFYRAMTILRAEPYHHI